MAATARTITPKKVKEFPDYLDFEGLRAEGLRHIQELAGEIWTDHNSHDPGITLLEVLCYALTDLGYRTNLDIRDLLAQAPDVNQTDVADSNFPTAAHVLTCNPLTILDYRKLLLDTEGVRNAWLYVVNETNTPADAPGLTSTSAASSERMPASSSPAFINGLYTVLLELDDAFLSQEAAKGNDATGNILANVIQKLHAHRNFCEDYFSVHILRNEEISLCGEIELSTNANPDDVVLTMLERIQEFLSPTIPFYTLNEMRARNFTPDQLFEGHPLNLDKSYGFVDTNEVAGAELRSVIHVSDIYRVLLDTDGITAVKNLRLINKTNGTNPEGEEWILPLTPSAFRPVLDAVKTINSLTLTKRNVAYGVNADRVLSVFKKKLANQLKVYKKEIELDLPIELGTYRGRRTADTDSNLEAGLGDHFSIQNDLPAIYGTSWTSFPSRTTTPDERERQVQALQLKGYLLFFDQLFANYLAQLANVRNLFSTTLDPVNDGVLSVGNLDDIPFLSKLLPFAGSPDKPSAANAYFSEGETIAKIIDPKTGHRRVFATPAERNVALKQLIKSFDADSVELAFITNKETGRVRFQVSSQVGHLVVLQSTKTYASETDALAAVGTVRFLATLETSYALRRQLPAHAHHYTFDWVFRPPADFQQIMKQILESPATYFQRKNALFDHLLGRFAEDFTDYTLLMFGLHKNNPQRLTNEQMAADKASFLRAYPAISRNRGQGFNQLGPPSDYWQGTNVSGIENRLATMLGLNRRQNKQLNFFDIVTDTRKLIYFVDRRGDVVLQAPYVNQTLSIETFRKDLSETEKSSGAFIPFVDVSEQVFSFTVTKPDGCVVAIHPETYGSSEARDAMLRYTRLVVSDPDRLPVDYVATERGFYTKVMKADGTVLFRSVTTVSSLDQTGEVSLRIRREAANGNQYEKRRVKGKGFSFQLLTTGKDATPLILAEHPAFYKTAPERDEVMAQTLHYFSENPLSVSIRQLPTRHYWSVSLAGENRLEGIHFFKTREQTKAAADRAKALLKESPHLEVRKQEDGKFCVRMVEHRLYPAEQPDEKSRVVRVALAQTQPVTTQREAEQLLNDIRRLSPSHAVQYLTKPPQFYAELVGTNGQIELRDVRVFDDTDQAELAFDGVLEAACLGHWERDNTRNNGCAFGFSLYQDIPGKRLANHPRLYDTASERDKVLADIEANACLYRIRVESEVRNDSWQFELYYPRNEGRLAVILREPAGSIHTTEQEARQFFETTARATLAHLSDAAIQKIDQDTAHSFVILADKNIIAEHPETYETMDERDAAIRFVKLCLPPDTSEKLPEGFSLVSTAQKKGDGFIVVEDVCECHDKTDRQLDRRRWRVWDEKAHVAQYTQVFARKSQVNKCRRDLIRHYQCYQPTYSELVLGGGATPADGHWVIRDKTQELWRSLDSFGSQQEARQAFEQNLMPIITASLDLNNYRISPVINQKTFNVKFRIELLDHRYGIMAVSVLFETALLAQQAMAKRFEYARLFPFQATQNGIYFQLYNRQTLRTEWRSTQAYPTWELALDGFMTFVDMLSFSVHYQLSGDNECGWQVVLTEVLLEGATSFYTKVDSQTTEAEAETVGWDQVESFLDQYQATDPARVVYPYIDYCAGSQYRFQLVSDAYVLARHPVAFHTSTERETRRDELFWLWQNQSTLGDFQNPKLDKVDGTVASSMQHLDNLFVVVEPVPSGGHIYLLGVRDKITQRPIVFEFEYTSEIDLIEDVRRVYAKLKSNPQVDRLAGGIGFEIRAVAGTESHQLAGLGTAYEFPHYEVLWESVETYTNLTDYTAVLKRCQELLTRKRNYGRWQAPDQSLTLVLTVPEEVLATQPRRYDSLSACHRAAERCLQYIDTEGFHVVEHVLLRPRHTALSQRDRTGQTASARQLIRTAEEDEQHEFEAYVIGSDPYSMTATVVLPYWSRRFRSVDFRQFFENTLRRETPVHVLLNIVWITPQQMQLFENYLRGWLDEIERPLSDEFAHRTDCLFALLGQLTNTFPHAILNDCNGAPVILDETTID